MATHYFAWLGSKRARKQGVADRGSLLDEAARLRLPVPNGGILLDIFYRLLLQEELLTDDENGATVVDPEGAYEMLYTAVRFPRLEQPVLLQGTDSSVPLPTFGPLSLNTTTQLTSALEQVYSALSHHPPEIRRDILMIERLDANCAGTAVFSPTADHDAVHTAGAAISLPRLGRWRRPDETLPPHLRRLQLLLRGVRHAFGSDTQLQIRWIDDGDICRLVLIDREED